MFLLEMLFWHAVVLWCCSFERSATLVCRYHAYDITIIRFVVEVVQTSVPDIVSSSPIPAMLLDVSAGDASLMRVSSLVL